jgi:hypothetical protein
MRRPGLMLIPTLGLIATLILACGKDEADGPSAEEEAARLAAAAAQVKTPTFEEQLALARRKALSLDAAGALAEAEKLVVQKPEDDAVWRLLELTAIAAGQAEAVSARLDAGNPIGGRTGPHHLLRAELALAAGRGAEAQSSATAALADDGDGAAALLARAAAAGAPLPPGATTPAADRDPADALLNFVTAKDAKAAAPFAEKAGLVAGWRAALLRAETRQSRGDLPGALAEFQRAAESSPADPRAVVRGNLGRASLALNGITLPGDLKVGPVEALAWAKVAAEVAISEGDAASALRAMEIASTAGGRGLQSAEALAVLTASSQSISSSAEGAVVGRAELVLARTAAEAGMPVVAAEAAAKARSTLQSAGEAEAAAEAAWQEGLASHALGRLAGLEGASGALSGARQQALQALVYYDKGDSTAARAKVPAEGLMDPELVSFAPFAARLDPANAARWWRDAVAAADRLGAPVARISTRLALEDHARAQGLADAGRVRAELQKLAPAGAAGDALRAEVAVRSILEGGAGSIPTEGALPIVSAWAALSSGSAASASADGAWVATISAWAAGRVAAAAGSDAAAERFNSALGLVPTHRHGPLSMGTVLDGSSGFPVDVDLDLLGKGKASDATVGAALAAHELIHRVSTNRSDISLGRDPTVGLAEADREAVLAGAALVRAGIAELHAGSGRFPEAAVRSYEAAEKKAASVPAFASLLPVPGAAVSEIRSRLSGAALVSYHFGRGRVHGVVLTPGGGALKELGKEAAVRDLARAHYASLAGSAATNAKADHRAGDKLRLQLLDPFVGELTGIGRYLVVAPAALSTFSFTTFPEQASGLRFLADIRTICTSGTVRIAMRPEPQPRTFSPDYLAIAAPQAGAPAASAAAQPGPAAPSPTATPTPATPTPTTPTPTTPTPTTPPLTAGAPEDGVGKAPVAPATDGVAKTSAPGVEDPNSDAAMLARHRSDANLPPDVAAGARNFGEEFRKALVSSDVTVAAWESSIPTARYIHISHVPATADGGFQLGDGSVGLADLRLTPIVAKLVIITAPATIDQQNARARAFLDAGAEAVLVSAWPIDDGRLDRMMDGFFQALNRDRPPARAIGEARESLLRDSLSGEDLDDPGLWGSLLLFANP